MKDKPDSYHAQALAYLDSLIQKLLGLTVALIVCAISASRAYTVTFSPINAPRDSSCSNALTAGYTAWVNAQSESIKANRR